MIAACVIDASMAIKWVIIEEGTQAANHLRWSGTALHPPDLLVADAGNILRKKMQRHELTQSEAELAGGILRLARIEIHSMGPQALLALQMAVELGHPVYDMAYLALARALGMPMVTADRRLVDKLAAVGSLLCRRLCCCRDCLTLSASRRGHAVHPGAILVERSAADSGAQPMGAAPRQRTFHGYAPPGHLARFQTFVRAPCGLPGSATRPRCGTQEFCTKPGH